MCSLSPLRCDTARAVLWSPLLLACVCWLTMAPVGLASEQMRLKDGDIQFVELASDQELEFALVVLQPGRWRLSVAGVIDEVWVELEPGPLSYRPCSTDLGRVHVAFEVSGPMVVKARLEAQQGLGGSAMVRLSRVEDDGHLAQKLWELDRLATLPGMQDAPHAGASQRLHEEYLQLERQAAALGETSTELMARLCRGLMPLAKMPAGERIDFLAATAQRAHAAGFVRTAGVANNAAGLAALEALEHERALEFFERVGASAPEARIAVKAASNRCLTLLRRGTWTDASECYESWLARWSTRASPKLVQRAKVSLSGALSNQGLTSQAAETLLGLLVDLTSKGGRSAQRLLAQVHNNVGALERRMGNFDAALGHYSAALASFEELGDRRWQGRTLNNLGYCYWVFGDAERALRLFEIALEHRRASGDTRGEIVTQRNVSRALATLGDLQGARAAAVSGLELAQKVKSQRDESASRLRLAEVLLRLGDVAQAAQELQAALALRKEADDEPGVAEVVFAQARLASRKEHHERALRLFDTAHEAFDSVHDVVSALEADVGRAGALFRLHRLAEAALAAGRSRERLRAMTGGISDPALRQRLTGVHFRVLALSTRIALSGPIEAGSDARIATSFLEVERGKSGLLRHYGQLQYLGPNAVDSSPRDEPLLGPGTQAENLSVGVIAARSTVGALVGQLLQRQPKQRSQEIRGELDSVLALLESASSAVGVDASARGELASVPELQALLQPGDLLLGFLLGEEGSFRWSVSRTTIAVQEMPKLDELTELVSAARGALSTVDVRTRRSSHSSLLRLSAVLLEGLKFEAVNRMFVSVDGALNDLSASVLGLPEEAEAGRYAPLVQRMQVVRIPSATLLRGPDRARARRPVLVFADPVFDRNDTRTVRKAGAEESSLEHDAGGDGLGSPPLGRLAGSLQEVAAITAVGQGALVPVHAVTGFDASVATLESLDLTQYSVVHLATHGVLLARQPELSGIVLSRFDENGAPVPGFFGLHQALSLQLDDALVVLSGCDTARGRNVLGNGVLGLNSALLVAGAHSVLGTLWPVEDEVAALVAQRFYSHLWKGADPGGALARMQQEFLASERHSDPHYWGAYVLTSKVVF